MIGGSASAFCFGSAVVVGLHFIQPNLRVLANTRGDSTSSSLYDTAIGCDSSSACVTAGDRLTQWAGSFSAGYAQSVKIGDASAARSYLGYAAESLEAASLAYDRANAYQENRTPPTSYERVQEWHNSYYVPYDESNGYSPLNGTNPTSPASYGRVPVDKWGFGTAFSVLDRQAPVWWDEEGYHAYQACGCFGYTVNGYDTTGYCLTGDFEVVGYTGFNIMKATPGTYSWAVGTTAQNFVRATDVLEGVSGGFNVPVPLSGKFGVGLMLSPEDNNSINPKDWDYDPAKGASVAVTIGTVGASVTYGLKKGE